MKRDPNSSGKEASTHWEPQIQAFVIEPILTSSWWLQKLPCGSGSISQNHAMHDHACRSHEVRTWPGHLKIFLLRCLIRILLLVASTEQLRMCVIGSEQILKKAIFATEDIKCIEKSLVDLVSPTHWTVRCSYVFKAFIHFWLCTCVVGQLSKSRSGYFSVDIWVENSWHFFYVTKNFWYTETISIPWMFWIISNKAILCIADLSQCYIFLLDFCPAFWRMSE